LGRSFERRVNLRKIIRKEGVKGGEIKGRKIKRIR